MYGGAIFASLPSANRARAPRIDDLSRMRSARSHRACARRRTATSGPERRTTVLWSTASPGGATSFPCATPAVRMSTGRAGTPRRPAPLALSRLLTQVRARSQFPYVAAITRLYLLAGRKARKRSVSATRCGTPQSAEQTQPFARLLATEELPRAAAASDPAGDGCAGGRGRNCLAEGRRRGTLHSRADAVTSSGSRSRWPRSSRAP